MSLGTQIKKVRLLNGWTLEQFGEEIGKITTSNIPIKGNIANWEHDKSQPSPERLKAIATLGSTSVAQILKDSEAPSEELEARLERIEHKLDLILDKLDKES